MPFVETVTATEAYRSRCEDRLAVFNTEDRTVIVVADGAGGIGSGDLAAQRVIDEIKSRYKKIHSADQWNALLKQIDFDITAGESTAVVLDIRPYGIVGISVGDSQAMIIEDGRITNLTKKQIRKPLLGSGSASLITFQHRSLNGLLLVATDGFFDYAKQDTIIQMIARTDFYAIPKRCVEMVRLPSGELWDDLGIVVGRIAPKYSTRKRYSI